MERILVKLQWEICLVYLDDIITKGRTVDELVDNLSQVFDRLQKAGLKLKPKKCHLFQKQVLYLGHVVSEEGIATDPEKIKAVKAWPSPRNPKEVRSFLGLAGYYRRFVKSFADIAKPLYRLTENNRDFVWTKEAESAFQTLKQKLMEAPILGYPNNKDSELVEFYLNFRTDKKKSLPMDRDLFQRRKEITAQQGENY
jgi:hypothetical protein